MFGLGLIKGLGITLRHFVESYTHDRKPWEPRYNQSWADRRHKPDTKGIFTIQYPEEKRNIAENFRFQPRLVYDKTPDEPRCTACGICARVCPTQCIWIQRATDEKGRPKAQPAGYWIDGVICMSCGSCAEYCPFDAIKMNQIHEVATPDRDRDLFYSMDKLLIPVERYAQWHPTDYRREEEERRAKEEAKRMAEEAKKAAVAQAEATAAATAPLASKAASVPAPAPAPAVKAAEPSPPPEPAPAPATAPLASEAAPASPPEPVPTPGTLDDLKLIEGIGPKIAGVLQAAGIRTFAQLAETEVDRIKQILEEADPRLLRLADPTTWPRQARMAAAGKWEALQKWQEKLKAGRQE